jgi:hypothetical protein
MNDQTSNTGNNENPSLADNLAALAEHLAGAAPEPGWQLAALIPCDLVVGPAAVACWASPEQADDAWEWALVSLTDGAIIEDRAAIRDAFTLVAMHEALADALDAPALRTLRDRLRASIEALAGPAAELAEALERVAAAAEKLASNAPVAGEPMLARADLLDLWGGQVRELERHMDAVDIHAERWSRDHAEDDPDAVRTLWMLLADIRGGVLAQPVSLRLQAGRDAGVALAEQVLGA